MLDKLICFQKAANKNLTPYLSEKISKLTNILYMDFSDMMATKFLVSSSLNAFSTSQKQIEKFSFLKNSLCLVTFLCLSRICILIVDFFFLLSTNSYFLENICLSLMDCLSVTPFMEIFSDLKC